MTQKILSELVSLLKDINKTTTVNINTKSLKDKSVKIGSDYFNELRPYIPKIEGATINYMDALMQDLIRLGHGNNSKSSYKNLISDAIAELKEINIEIASTPKIESHVIHPNEQKIIDTLVLIVPTAGFSYEQALLDISQAKDRVSFRGTANELRESLRETLDHLAPDAEVTKEPDFRLESGQNRPTMKQKVRFILKSRGHGESKRGTTEKTAQLIEELFGQITRAIYDRASLATHKKSERDEIQKIKRFVDVVLLELLEL